MVKSIRSLVNEAMPESSVDVVVIGHIQNERVIFPDRVLYPVLGSPAAYSSVCLSRLGTRVGLVTRIGRDFPDPLLGVLSEAKIDKIGITTGSTSTCNELIYDERGYKVVRFLSRAPELLVENVPRSFSSARFVYVCPIDGEVSRDTVRQLRDEGRELMVDLGGFGGATSAEHPTEKDGREVRKMCSYFSIVKASSEDLRHIFGILSSRDVPGIARQLTKWGAGMAVITLGKDGAYVRGPQGESVVSAFPEPEDRVLDPTGAGDCFSAGFIHRYLTTRDPVESTVFANAVTSYVIEGTGGVTYARMPSLAEASVRAEQIRNNGVHRA